MTPTADQVALAIVEASKVTGADPITVACGDEQTSARGWGKVAPREIVRARYYALVALVETLDCARPLCAKLIGIKHPATQAAIYGTIESRLRHGEMRWFDRAVVEAIKAKLGAERTVEVSAFVAPPPYRPPPGTVEKMLAKPKPHPLGTRGPDGYRPPEGTIARVVEDDEDDGPVLQRSHFGMERQREYHPSESKTTLRDMLRQAVENTARAQPKATDG
jgi:hypothetical protein